MTRESVTTPMTRRVHVIACAVLAVDIEAALRRLGVQVSVQFLPGGLHNTPHELRRRLQEAVDQACAAGPVDLIAIGYGVCGLGTVGIHARHVPLAIPRVHDCIALFLGSDAAYREQFSRYPGTYYISAGWVEEKAQPPSHADQAPAQQTLNPLEPEELIEKYGRENAELIRYFLRSWQRNYQRAAFIDTGVAGRRRYAEIARAMAREFGWRYEELSGTGRLLEKLLTTDRTTDEVLVVPPHHVTTYDPLSKGLSAVPVWESEPSAAARAHRLVFDQESDPAAHTGARPARLGLGIDAGGTYTDAVLYDFRSCAVLQKAKALTTKWDLTVGIGGALERLDAARLVQVDLVAISTTLATNAVVEGRGQKVGLLLMPPYGLFDPADVNHSPLAVIGGRLEIDGAEIAPVDPDQVRRVARSMIERDGVQAFAVAGYASHCNPSHELQAKAILLEETGLTVTCGHEVSDLVNYRLRAQTAALNASIIPFLEKLLDRVQLSLSRRGMDAPVMVVKSDGSLMSVQAARERPIETVLSGPAASVAGAQFLAALPDAMVVDMGGTTTDTAVLRAGAVQVCEKGANIGGRQTHIRALKMRTLGLGGDSLIAWQKGQLRIGPRRVAPVSWLVSEQPEGARALDWLERHLDHFNVSTRPMDLLALNGRAPLERLTAEEERVVELLAERPHSVHELAYRACGEPWLPYPLGRLEDSFLIQRCGLTPTDVLHAMGWVHLWDADAARRICDLFARLMGMKPDAFLERVVQQVVQSLALELLKKQLDEDLEGDRLEESPAAMALIRNLMNGGTDHYRVRVALRHPVIGIGAPVHHFLPQAAELLETAAVIPLHADVANAIGAITSSICIRKQVSISPNEFGSYSLHGVPDTPSFPNFADAHQFAVSHLQTAVREMARIAGTSKTRVEILVDDSTAPVAYGGRIFLGRRLEARLCGPPDLARQTSHA